MNFRKALSVQWRWMKWMAKPMGWVLQPLLLSLYFGVIGYLLGVGLKSFPSVELVLNGGFTLMGVNPEYRFPEFLGTLSAVVSYVGGLLRVCFGAKRLETGQKKTEVLYTNRAVELAEKPEVNIEAISDHLTTVDMRQEVKLQKAGILDLDDLSNADPNIVKDLLGVSDFLATEMVEEAKEVISGLRVKGVA